MTKLCQGPSCHMYDTTDRKRGPKGNKRNYTRTIGQLREDKVYIETLNGPEIREEKT